MPSIIVIGGGAAGMMAAGVAAEFSDCTLLEKNEKLGKKLYITGKGRCNLTNNTDIQGLLKHTVTNPKFLQSSFNAVNSAALMDFFESKGLKLKTERGGRVFPESDKAGHVTDTLAKYIGQNGAKVKLNSMVKSIEILENNEFYVHTSSGKLKANAVIIATGGLSYPSTGSTGDGYILAQSLGHTIQPTYPSLVPINTAENWDLEGLSLINVKCTVKGGKKKPIFEELGEMMFTAKGVTGPVILRASAYLTDKLPANLTIDLKPALTHQQLDNRILRDFSENPNKNFENSLNGLLPQRLIGTIVKLSEIPPDKKINNITKAQRQVLVNLLKALPLTLTKTADYNEAVITKGGITVKEINPSTLMSKEISGIFFAGEVMDVDALTGGYNLQIAFSTGYLAGKSAGEYVSKTGKN